MPIASDPKWANDPRMTRLMTEARLTLPAALGHWHMLLYWCLEFAPDGNVSGIDPNALERGAGWDGMPGVLAAALQPGFITTDGRIYDWSAIGLPEVQERQRESRRRDRNRGLFNNRVLLTLARQRDLDRCRYCGHAVKYIGDRRSPLAGTYDIVDPEGPESLENVVVCCSLCRATKDGRALASVPNMRLLPQPTAENLPYLLYPDGRKTAENLPYTADNLPSLRSSSTAENLPSDFRPNGRFTAENLPYTAGNLPSSAQVASHSETATVSSEAAAEPREGARALGIESKTDSGTPEYEAITSTGPLTPSPTPSSGPPGRPSKSAAGKKKFDRGDLHPLTDEDRAVMHERWDTKCGGVQAVNDLIDDAMGHEAVEKRTNLPAYVNNWLRREANRLLERRPHHYANGNGHGPTSPPPAARQSRATGTRVRDL